MEVSIESRHTDIDGWRWYGEPGPESQISVTTILSQAVANPKLANWFKKTTEAKIAKVSNEAANFGTDAHEIFESILSKKQIEIPAHQRPHANAFNKWVEQNEVVSSHLEIPLVSHKLGVAGTADFIGSVNKEPTLCDWKTSKRYSITSGWQMAFYRRAAIEMGYVDESCGLMGVQIPRDTAEIKTFKYEHIDFVEHAILCSLEVFKALHYGKLKKLGWKWLHERAI